MNYNLAQQISSLLNERNNLTKKYTPDNILESEDNYQYIFENDKIIAVAEIVKVQWYQWEIKHVSVNKEFEGKGFGNKIIEIAEFFAFEQNARIIQCTIRSNNWSSIKLFEKNGYNKTLTFYNNVSKNYVHILQKNVSTKEKVNSNFFNFSQNENLTLYLNEYLYNYRNIKNILDKYKIKYTNIDFADFGLKEHTNELENFCLSFSNEFDFIDVWKLAKILKDYGLKYVSSSDDNVNINIGYLDLSKHLGINYKKPTISIDDFLEINIQQTSKEVIDKYFNTRNTNIKQLSNYHDRIEDSNHYSNNNDYDRDTFNELTDGQFGSYDDFDGDIDDMMTSLGRD